MARFDGKTAIVTGGGSGQGFATAGLLASEGARVLALDVNTDGLEKLAAEFPSVITQRCDVSNVEDAKAAISRAEKEFGRLNALLNCAGILRVAPFLETNLDDFDLVFKVNVKGMFLLSQLAIPLMQRSGGGSIVNWGSINSLVAEPDIAAYNASKGAVLMLTKSIAIEHAKDNIRATCICPGAVVTPMSDEFYSESLRSDLEAQRKIQPLGFARPDDIASVAAFLASDDSRMITGTAVMVDGGFTAL